jgi:hypothetical protein
MKLWTWKRENLPSPSHAFRTAVAATISILAGRLVGLPEAYWAAIATVVVMQSPLGDTVPLAIERIVASALGALIGAIESTYFGANLFVFALAMLLLGLISFVLRLEKVGYSYACITLAIIVLIPRAAMDCCGASLRRSLTGNSRGTRGGGRLAGGAAAFRQHDRQITNSWLLAKEVYLCKIHKFVAAQRCFCRKQRSAYPTLLRRNGKSPCLIPLLRGDLLNGMTDTG